MALPAGEVNPLALPADWGYQLACRFLAAAQACGFCCDRAFVVDAYSPGLCCDPCQLMVKVDEEIRRWDDGLCCFRNVARVTVMVDLCFVKPDDAGDWDWRKSSPNAQMVADVRGQILAGIKRYLDGNLAGFDWAAWLVDPIALDCSKVSGGSWSIIDMDRVCARHAISFVVTL